MATVSFVIPVYNAEKSIKRCLDAIYAQTYKDFEVVVVDDNSTDNSVNIIKKYRCELIQLEKNEGPARARNVGVSRARGEYIMFVDGDCILSKNSLEYLIESFKTHPEAACVSGVFSAHPIHKDWFGLYRDLQLYWWHFNSDENASVFLLTGGMIKKEIFKEIGGFNEDYKNADAEDYEFGHRVSKRYEMLLDKRVRYNHYDFHSPFFNLIEKLFMRSMMWVPLFIKRGKLESNYATANKAVAVGFAFLTLISFITSLIYPGFLYITLASFLLFILSDIGFYVLVIKKKGLLFLIYTVVVHFIMQLTIATGIIAGFLLYPIKK